MATITINIPADNETWLLDGLAFRFGYPELVTNPAFDASLAVDASTNPLNIPNPETKLDFAKDKTMDFLKTEATQGYISEDWHTRKNEESTVILT